MLTFHFVFVPFYEMTNIEACLRRASLLRRAVDGVSAKALWHQCFNESTINVSYVDDRELGNWSKAIPMATMWQCFRVITCKACMHACMSELARHACMHAWVNLQGMPACTWSCPYMLVCRMQADALYITFKVLIQFGVMFMITCSSKSLT